MWWLSISVRRIEFGHRVLLDLCDPRLVPVRRWSDQTSFVVIVRLDDQPCVVNAVVTPEVSMGEVMGARLSENLMRRLAGRFVSIVRYLNQETVRHPDSSNRATHRVRNAPSRVPSKAQSYCPEWRVMASALA